MTDTDLAYFGLSALVLFIIAISVRNMNRNFQKGQSFMMLLWLNLLLLAILYWGFVSQYTDADTKAFWLIEGKLRLLWRDIERLKLALAMALLALAR